MKNKRAIIVGSGASIRQGFWDIPVKKNPLWKQLQTEFSIGINWCFKWHVPTVELYGDFTFYIAEKEQLEKLPLVFGMQDAFYGREIKKDWTNIFHYSNNIYLLKNRTIVKVDGKQIEYHSEHAWEKGFYRGILTGATAINLAVALGYTEIFLLGFDANATDGFTHFYEDEFVGYNVNENGKKRTGIGFKKESGFGKKNQYNTSFYNQDVNTSFEVFKQELNKIKIYNVSPNSKISIFPKITYDDFYKKLLEDKSNISQDSLRQEIIKVYYDKYYN